MGNNSAEVLHGTFSAILQYTPERNDKLKFVGSVLMSKLRKNVFTPGLSSICLSTLIHFATEAEFIHEFVPLIEPLVLKMREWKDLELELSLLLILNISQDEEVVAKLINQDEKHGYLVEVLYGLLEHQEKCRWILVSIFTNLTASERGRKFMVEDHICSRFAAHFHAFDEKLREASLKIVRNCAFEWEDEGFAKEVLAPELKLVDRLGQLMAYLIHRLSLVNDPVRTERLVKGYFIIPGELERWDKGFNIGDRSKALAEVGLAIDIILILSNADFKQKGVKADRGSFMELLGLLKFTDIAEETKDKLEALEIFCF